MKHLNLESMKNKTIDELTPAEWESLCDHCGLCCLQKIEDKNSGEVKYIGLACEFLDIEQCDCLVYENRHFANPDCVALTRDTIRQIKWLPDSCAYRRLAEGRELEWWHPLKSGDPETVHQAGISVRDKAVSGQGLSNRVEDTDIDI
jgi:uncharacterized cysteine cluster protein YcgN (CxxCxxCC family)